MQLISLETQNFKRLRHFKADFTQGLNVIVGDNAQGKSTLLQAIECALYGPSVVPGKKDKIPTWGQSSWKVELEFSINGDVYELTRSKSTAKLVHVEGSNHGDKLVANGNTPVTQHVTELLDLNAKDYNLFMQSKQGETSGVLTFGAAALNRKVEEYAGISLIDQVQGLAQEEYRTAKAEADALAVDQDVIDTQAATVAEMADQLDGAHHALEEAQAGLDTLPKHEDLEKPDVDPDTLQKQLDQYIRLTYKLENVRGELSRARDRHGEAQTVLSELTLPDNLEELEGTLKQQSRRAEKSSKHTRALQKEMDRQVGLWEKRGAAKAAVSASRAAEEVEQERVETLARSEEAHKRLADAKGQEAALEQRIEQLNSLKKDAVCPTCNTRISEHDPDALAKEIVGLATKKVDWEQQADDFRTEARDADKRLNQLDKELEQLASDSQRLEDLEAQLRRAGVDLTTAESPVEQELDEAIQAQDDLLTEKARLEHLVETNEAQWRRYRKAMRAEEVEREYLAEVEDELAHTQNCIKKLEQNGVPSDDTVKQAREALNDYQLECNQRRVARLEAQQQVDLAKGQWDSLKQSLAQAEEKLENLRSTRAESKQAAKRADQSARLSRFLREKRAGYLKEVWDAVLGAASKQVRMASKGMITGLLNDNGSFLYEEDGVLIPVESASGAQKAHIGVALRVGLARALYGSNALLIFDEPTESMSEHHAAGLTGSLAGAAAQCLLITHREQDQDLASNVVEVG